MTPTPHDQSGPGGEYPGGGDSRYDPTGHDPTGGYDSGDYRKSTNAYTDPSGYPGTSQDADPSAYQPPMYADYSYPEPPRSEPTQPGPAYPSAPAPMSYPPPAYPQSAYPQQYPPPGRSQGRDKSLLIVLICVAALVIIGLLIVGAYFLLDRSSDSSTDTQSTPTVTQTVNPAPTSTVTVAPPATPPPGAVSCGAGVSAGTSVTSCSFAQAVRDEYLRTGVKGQSRVISAYSPVTGMSYVMSCGPEGGVVACRGGNNAVVYVY